MPKHFSVVTIVKGRRKQLSNLLQSIAESTCQPNDVQVVCMDDASDIHLPATPSTINLLQVEADNALPLALARNLGFDAAQTEHVIFVDVDCIVSPTLFATLLEELNDNAVISAYPRYLAIVPNNGKYDKLVSSAISHPARETIPPHENVQHLKFWSIIFAITKQNYKKVGGFDESFTGYGAEDTDFAMSFHAQDLQLRFVTDYVLHQYHDKFDPPLNYFVDIVNNADTFKEKWGFYPMQRWLNKFYDLGLIANFEAASRIAILRHPTDVEIEQCRSTQPY